MTNIRYKILLAVLAAAISGGLSLTGSGQTPPPVPQPAQTAVPSRTRVQSAPPSRHISGPEGTYERAIAVAANVNLTLCVTEGNLKVNGWNRNEVRLYVEGGPKFSFKVIDNGPDAKPVWISTTNEARRPGINNDCIWGAAVEIDVPRGSTLNLQGKAIDAQIDGLRKVGVKTVGGDISIRNVKEGVTANTYEGDVTVEESWGQVALESSTGNIVVVDSGPSEIGDTFKAKTNSGAVSLTRVTHRAQEVNSISGSVLFNGELKSGGTYAFGTSNGTIRLALPAMTGCKFAATYTSGSFTNELPFNIDTENVGPNDLMSVVGRIGAGGDALLKLTTVAGMIGIKKQ